MSVIAFKVFEDKIQVAADERCVSDDKIISEHYTKVYKISDSLIIGVTGLADTIGIFKKFVEANKVVFEKLDNVTDTLPLFKRFRDYVIDNYGFNEESVKEFGGFFFTNKKFHATIYYSEEYHYPFAIQECNSQGAFGSTGIYTTALIDSGMELEEAIKRSAEKYTSINGNVTILEIER